MFRAVALVLGLTLCLFAKTPKQDVLATSTDRVEFTAGGTIRIAGSLGELDIEGWDQPTVEITVTRSVWRDQSVDAATGLLNRVQVKAERTSSSEIKIHTVLPARNFLVRPFLGKTAVALQYVIRVPRDSHLIIHHGSGDLRLEGLTGTIEASVPLGDLELRLPDPNSYSIDAECVIGGIFSDFDGRHHGHYLVGERFDAHTQPSAPRALLRVGTGGIQILKTGTHSAAAR